MVALMIERLSVSSGMNILEVGLGSGYHAACIMELVRRRVNLIGIELDSHLASMTRQRLNDTGYSRVIVIEGDGWVDIRHAKSLDRIYVTASTERQPTGALVRSLRPGGLLQWVRPITEAEFASEPRHSWLRHEYANYPSYLDANWRNYACLTTAAVNCGTIRELSHLYDVSFIALTRPLGNGSG
jgi:predicted O-methyltransferase YrrM